MGVNQGNEKRKIWRVLDTSGNYKQVMVQTTADQVILNNAAAGVAATNVQDAFKEIADIAATGGVTGVKGAKEAEFRKGNVSISAENVGAVEANAAITGGTAIKITYDAKGLVTKGDTLSAGDIPDLSATYIPVAKKGVKEGVAELDSNGKVPSAQLPSYVDDVIEGSYVSETVFNDTEGKPVTNESGKIYLDTATNKQYRWSGSKYVEICASLALGETADTAYAGNKGKANADAITKLQGTQGTQGEAIAALQESQGTQDTAIQGNTDAITSITNGTTPVTASKLNEEKAISIKGAVTGSANTDFSGKTVEINTTIADNSIASAKLADIAELGGAQDARSVVSVNAKGQVVGTANLIEFGSSTTSQPSKELVIGGLFFALQE